MTLQMAGLTAGLLVLIWMVAWLWLAQRHFDASPASSLSDPAVFLRSSGVLLNLPADSLSLKIDLSPELIETLAQIQRTTGDSPDEVLAKAIALYRMSVEAHQEGKRIGVLDRNFELEREVVGFEHRASA